MLSFLRWAWLLIFVIVLASCVNSKDLLQAYQPQSAILPNQEPIDILTWPEWANKARIAGFYVEPEDSDEEINQHLDNFVLQGVSVVLADSPWGEDYSAWVDDERFISVKNKIEYLIQSAHARNLKIVLYITGLELISNPNRNPGLEHPSWAQLSMDGNPLLYNDISSSEEFWIDLGEWDFWLTPCSGDSGGDDSFSEFYLARLHDIADIGMDGIWVDQVYLQSGIGQHEDLWPSSDPCSVEAFQATTGLTFPNSEDWDDSDFLHWLVWRHIQVADFLNAQMDVVHSVDPSIVFFVENSNTDTGRSTYVANDPTYFIGNSNLSTAHEIETIADRIDEGETGMKDATLDEWLSFRTMVAFARCVDKQKPSWILTYGYQPADSAKLAGLVLAEGANFYETQGPGMDGTVGSVYRQNLFNWIRDNEHLIYNGDSIAQIGLLYSPRTRDLVDSASGEPYDVEDSVHIAAYRAAANLFYQNHIPFDVVIDTDNEPFERYHFLILPEVQAMSEITVAALKNFSGEIIAIGETGFYDEWYQPRPQPALTDIPHIYLPNVNQQLINLIDTDLLMTDAPPTVQIEPHRLNEGYAIVLVNLASEPSYAFSMKLSISPNESITKAHFETLEGDSSDIPYVVDIEHAQVIVDVPAGLETTAILTLFHPTDIYLPVITR